jgi:hypothetical protein
MKYVCYRFMPEKCYKSLYSVLASSEADIVPSNPAKSGFQSKPNSLGVELGSPLRTAG